MATAWGAEEVLVRALTRWAVDGSAEELDEKVICPSPTCERRHDEKVGCCESAQYF
jgi:hypothetical protein